MVISNQCSVLLVVLAGVIDGMELVQCSRGLI